MTVESDRGAEWYVIDFAVELPGTGLPAEYRWGPYVSRIDARVDASYMTADWIRINAVDADARLIENAAFPRNEADQLEKLRRAANSLAMAE